MGSVFDYVFLLYYLTLRLNSEKRQISVFKINNLSVIEVTKIKGIMTNMNSVDRFQNSPRLQSAISNACVATRKENLQYDAEN